jgi:broad specificity phosphatase PhoE
VYLARHGQTALNAAGVLRGHLDPPLDTVGQLQAVNLGIALGRHAPNLVLSSPLTRARSTAQEVAGRAGLEVEVDQRLIDRDYGRWTGRPQADVIDRWGSLDLAPGVEPAAQVLVRAWAALADATRRVDDGVAVIVSHDAVNRLLLHAVDPGLGDLDAIAQETGCYNELEYRARVWVVLCVNRLPEGGA